MAVITEVGRAKLNLSLAVKGRRPDGYHEISSLIAFADIGDTVSLDTDGDVSVSVRGPFAGSISGRNLLDTALDLVREAGPQLRLGQVVLTKSLPVAAGIGGGSADAAALLRAVRQANRREEWKIDWHRIAVKLGADVAVCLVNRAAWVHGIGDGVEPLASELPGLNAVLVNPLVRVPPDKTAQVYRRLGAPILAEPSAALARQDLAFANREALIAYMRGSKNDLEAAACELVLEVAQVMGAVGALPGVELVRLSGSGPTCFGIFPSASAARDAADACAAAHPEWWVKTATVG